MKYLLIVLTLLSMPLKAAHLDGEMTMFFSYSCHPCQLMHKYIGRFAEMHQVEVAYIEVEQHPELCKELSVVATPTLYVGQERVSMEGLNSFAELDKRLLEMLKS